MSRTAAMIVLASPMAAPPFYQGEWLPLRDRSLEIAAGSPLDFSAIAGDLAGSAPLGMSGEALVLRGGIRPRVNCAMLGPGFSVTPGSGFPDHPTADRYARQLRRHGYNLVRFHHIDSLLMQGARADFAFNPLQLDRFQYMMAALKRNGIRWSLDMMTSDNAALGNIFPNRWAQRRGMRLRVYVESAALDHWRRLATVQLTTVNPYTGLAPARDPATALVILLNEGGIVPQSVIADQRRTGRFPDLLRPAYAAWLRMRHADPAAAAGPLPRFQDSGPEREQFQHFVTDRERAVADDMTATVRAAGYAGPVTAFDSWPQFNAVPSRRALALVDMHDYDQDPPVAQPGAKVRGMSSLDDAVRYFTRLASNRVFGRPFIVTEYDQPFWNSFRYESGLVAPAMAGLQNWQAMCRHTDGPVDLAYDGRGNRKDALQPDGAGLDPVARAGETLSALLQLRGEIAPAGPRVGLVLSDAQALAGGGTREISSGQGALAWVAQLGLLERPRGTDVAVPVTALTGAVVRAAAASHYADAAPVLAELRARGLLARGNVSDAAANRWESAGGQVRLDSSQRMLRVMTVRTSALVAEQVNAPVAIGPVRITATDAPALLGFSALDAAPLAKSRRVLVVLASDARNTGMQVAPDGTLLARGRLPVEVRRVRAAATLAAPADSRWRLVPLRLDGTADPGFSLRAGPDGLALQLDTALSPRGPTTFFLLERN